MFLLHLIRINLFRHKCLTKKWIVLLVLVLHLYQVTGVVAVVQANSEVESLDLESSLPEKHCTSKAIAKKKPHSLSMEEVGDDST